MDLEEVWRLREEEIYPKLFGPVSRGVFPLDQTMFTGQFGQSDIDPRWLTYCVIEFAPTQSRPSWLYVTSGHSNPWEQGPEAYDLTGVSGAGAEFILETTEQGDWAIRILQSMLAFDILLSVGRYPGRDVLNVNDRIPLKAPLNGDPDCQLRNLIATKPSLNLGEFTLPSGIVQLMSFLAVSDPELAYAKEYGSDAIISKLGENDFPMINDPNRNSVM